MAKRSNRDPVLEIQIHPSEIRWGVRYFFLDRRQITWGVLAVLAVCGALIFNAIVFPGVARNLMNRREYRLLVSERTRQGKRLQALTAQLSALGERTDDLHLRMNRVFLTYGLESDTSIGQGGYPAPEPEEGHSIYAAQIRQGQLLDGRIQEQLAVLDTFLDEVQSFEEAHSDQVLTTPSRSPLRGGDFVLTSPFGTRRSPFTKNIDHHPGIDLAATVGTPVYAPAEGVVAFAGRYPLRYSVSWWRYGNLVALRNGDRFITLFGHCDEIKVRTGQKVRQGEVIATVGNTGWSTNPHLHYEVRARDDEANDFRPVDPRIYILDHRWRDQERLLVRARRAPDSEDFEPLPRLLRR
jgi:murein DD-endopeptidase MepM/ murein hydrolase activator NlpD